MSHPKIWGDSCHFGMPVITSVILLCQSRKHHCNGQHTPLVGFESDIYTFENDLLEFFAQTGGVIAPL